MARSATIERNTKETWIQVALDLDGGPVSVETGIGFFDHMLTAFGFYAKIGLTIQASGDLEVDGHHTVEDTGICLGMQLLFDTGVEVRETDGLALVPGRVERIETNLKLPHIGWNSLHFPNPSPLFAGLGEGCYVYFVHSFCGNTADPKYVIASTDYGTQVTAAVQNGTVFGTQFHPEKSGEIGMQILRNFGGLTR